MVEQPAQRDLLLVAAGQFAHHLAGFLGAHVEALHPFLRRPALTAAADKAALRKGAVARHGQDYQPGCD